MNLVKPAEVARHFKYPVQTIIRWSKMKDWKNELYKKLEKDYIEHLAKESQRIYEQIQQYSEQAKETK